MNKINDLQSGVKIIAQETDYDIGDVQQSTIGEFPITSGSLADLLGISQEAFNKRHAKHLTPLQTIKQGKKRIHVYDMKPAVHYYLGRLKGGESKGDKAYHELELIKESYRKKRLENDMTEGITMSADTTITLLQHIVNTFRQGVSATPSRLAQPLTGMTNPREIRKLIEEELAEIFTMATRVVTDYQKSSGISDQSRRQAENTDNPTDPDTT